MFGKNRVSLLSGIVTLLAVSGIVNQSAAQNLNMTATIQSGCTIDTKEVPFGDINATSGGSASAVTLNITGCNFNGISATVTVDNGANGLGVNGLRQLVHETTGDKIEYTLNEATTSAGVVDPGESFLASFSSGDAVLSFSASILGSAVSGKTVGDYSDSVGITVSFALS